MPILGDSVLTEEDMAAMPWAKREQTRKAKQEQQRVDIAARFSNVEHQYSAGYDGPCPISDKAFKAADGLLEAYPALRRSLFPKTEIAQMEDQISRLEWEKRCLERKVKEHEETISIWKKKAAPGVFFTWLGLSVFAIVALLMVVLAIVR